MINQPLKINDVLKLPIVKVGANGDPVMIFKKMIIFLKGERAIIPGRLIKIKITRVTKHFAYAVRI